MVRLYELANVNDKAREVMEKLIPRVEHALHTQAKVERKEASTVERNAKANKPLNDNR